MRAILEAKLPTRIQHDDRVISCHLAMRCCAVARGINAVKSVEAILTKDQLGEPNRLVVQDCGAALRLSEAPEGRQDSHIVRGSTEGVQEDAATAEQALECFEDKVG